MSLQIRTASAIKTTKANAVKMHVTVNLHGRRCDKARVRRIANATRLCEFDYKQI